MMFNQEIDYHDGSIESWIVDIKALIEGENTAVFLSEKGIIGGGVVRQIGSDSFMVAQEVIWWAKDGQGIALLRRFIEWAKPLGASQMQIAHQLSEKTEQACAVFEREGFKPIEIGLRRNL